MARVMKYLNAEHMVGILRQRALELEADLYAQVKEKELGLKLGFDQVVAAAETKIAMFESALGDLDQQIEDLLKGPSQPEVPKPRRRNRDSSDGK